MNVEILKKLSSDSLKTLLAAVEAEIASRYDFSLHAGCTGVFLDKDRGVRHVRVLRVNTKTISAVELSDSVNPGERWKIPKQMLKVDGVEIDVRKARILAARDEKPSSDYDVSSW